MRFADSKHSYVSLQTLCFTFEFAETVCMLKRRNAASIAANPLPTFPVCNACSRFSNNPTASQLRKL